MQIMAIAILPVAVSVHTIVSFDFSMANVPMWHSTIFGPYFVAGAIFSGMAMVVTLAVPARKYLGLHDFITLRHLDNMNRIVLAFSLVMGYVYAVEFFMAWYAGELREGFVIIHRMLGPYAAAYWVMIVCNLVLPQLFWFRTCRTHPAVMFIVCILVNVGMWLERFVMVVSSLSRDFLPSSWADYMPTWVDVLTLAGSVGLFLTLFLLFCRYLPVVAVSEMRTVVAQESDRAGGSG
jgi:molybdopterin-containing oxidoreductase family membrane subunit